MIIRDWRYKSEHTPADERSDTKNHLRSTQPSRRPRLTSSRCCYLGGKIAKRKLPCEPRLLEVFRLLNGFERANMILNRPRTKKSLLISARLSRKIKVCIMDHRVMFGMCCKVLEQYQQRLIGCRYQRRKERELCQESVRQNYSMPEIR